MPKRSLSLALALFCLTAIAQPRYDYDRLSTERIDRGVVATRQTDGKVFVSWRTLRSDRRGEPFDIYRDGVKLNDEPLTTGGTWFIDQLPSADNAVYEVRGGGHDGRFLLHSDAPVGYLVFPVDKPKGGMCPTMTGGNRHIDRRGRRWYDDGHYEYTANDCSVGDVDGDGQYEIIVKWDPTNSHDNSHDGYTGPTLFDCYKIDWTNAKPSNAQSSMVNDQWSMVNGQWSMVNDQWSMVNVQLLWRIDMGRNIRSGAHYIPFIVYDLDGDGRAELMVKTADGTRDGTGHVIGDSTADYRNAQGRILDGPEYLSVFDGLTGTILDSQPYIPERGDPSSWGDSRGNRSERYLAAVGYLHGRLPSALFCRGYYTRTVIAAWDWDGKQLKEHWTFDTDNPEWQSYARQGNHNLRVADVDGDGYDEITYGSMAVDHNGHGLYNTRMGHGDALHLTAFDPTTDRLQVWDCHENRRDGSDFRDAATGEVIFQIKSNSDVGRAMAADIDPTNAGLEMWSTDSHGIRNIKGDIINPVDDADDPQHNNRLVMKGRWLPINFAVWWDGDLLRELLDHETVSKYDWENHEIVEVQKFDGLFNNGTKSTPCLSADIIGDWREEVIVRNRESTELRIYTTTIPTPFRINCLMHDIPYRLSVVTENVGYNQPPETGFYLGPDRTDYLK